MKTISIVSVKGGTGKSAVALLLAEYFAGQGKRVLFLDADPQNSATAYLANGGETRGDLARALMDEDIQANRTPIRDNLDLTASALALFKLRTLNPRTLARMMPAVAAVYDYCIIDTAPTLDGITWNAIHAADIVLTPSRADVFDLKTAVFLQGELLAEGAAAVWKVLPNFYRPPRSGDGLAGQLEAAYRDNLGKAVLPFGMPATMEIPKTFNLRTPVTRARKYWPALDQLGQYIEGGRYGN